MIQGAIASSFHFARAVFRVETKAGAAVRVHHLNARQNLRFKAKQLAGVGHLGVPARREMLALPAVDFV
jgi:hypothetical protein